eukprot:3568381-Lingulodinium_polyedra.AAC.1
MRARAELPSRHLQSPSPELLKERARIDAWREAPVSSASARRNRRPGPCIGKEGPVQAGCAPERC